MSRGAGEAQVHQILLDCEQLLIEVVGRLPYVLIVDDAREPFDLAARHLDAIHDVGGAVHIALQLKERRHLRLDLSLGPFRIRVLDDRQRLRERPSTGSQLDGVVSRRRENRQPAAVGGRPPTLRAHSHVGGVLGAGAQADVLASLVTQIPVDAVDTNGVGAGERPHHLPLLIEDGDGHGSRRRGRLQVVVDARAVRRVIARRDFVLADDRIVRDLPEPIGRQRREQMHRLLNHLRCELLERGQVVENPEAAPVGGDDQVVKAFLHLNAVHRRVRQIHLQRLPVLPIVERHVHRILSPEVQEAAANRIFLDAVCPAQHAVWNPVGDRLPRLAVVVRLVHIRIAIVRVVEIDREVGRRRVVMGRFDAADPAPQRERVEVLRQVRPGLPAVARHLHLTVIGARPDQAALPRRFGEKDNRFVTGAAVVAGEAARGSLSILVVQRQVGADHLPALAAVGCLVNVLAADVDLVVIER